MYSDRNILYFITDGHNNKFAKFYLPGHLFSLHFDSSFAFPGQKRLELRDPSGNTHSRVLFVLPPPQVDEQDVHSLHSVHIGHLFVLQA